eukprot:1976721-Prymnesium_polylepis.1
MGCLGGGCALGIWASFTLFPRSRMVRRSRGGMEGAGDMFVASDIAFGGSRVAYSRFAASVGGMHT